MKSKSTREECTKKRLLVFPFIMKFSLIFFLFFCNSQISFGFKIRNHSNIMNSILINSWESPKLSSLSEIPSFDPKTCPACIFNVRNRDNSNSSPSDVVISSMFFQSFNLIPCIRSLRTTGSKCSAVIFTDTSLMNQITSEFQKIMNDCGCAIFSIGTLSTKERKYLFMLRNIIANQFLEKNQNLFKRIIVFDLYDTIFQGDPFTADFYEDVIGFSIETTKIRGNHFKGVSIILGSEKASSKCYKKKIVNCGTIIGTTKVVLKFLKLFIQQTEKLSKSDFVDLIETQFPDQAIVNSFICGGIFDENGIKYHLYHATDDYISLYLLFRNKLNFTLGNFIWNSTKFPLLIHLFDRSKRFCKSVTKACPPTFNSTFPYIRCLNEFK
ncbi:hypothetical protein TRFO_05962 [Tritrichomonas foetus]|uniref:Uncharacterized protein n=1 Tax=Tritrichomonas foetus TaxID=1144522 RepID=A0A1J4K1R2_9EUKA|nr:hypothetical protein TRFO_05962 [Tritrichomonas foetus]|eukprot:OHT05377.1 hypothetical protein TRFO_05962 [Tritrichomonas foetus]